MIENYLRYHHITKEVLHSLMKEYDEERLAPMLREREILFEQFEKAGWPDADAAEVVIQDTLKMERECVKIIAARRNALKEELSSLKTKKYALVEYAAHSH